MDKHTILFALYVSAVDTQIKLASVVVSGVKREKFIGDSQDTTSEHDNSNDCDVCPTGRYRETNVQHTCKYCPAGTYNSYDNTAANTVHHDAHTDCKVCLSGKYRDTNGASSCADCPLGRARAVHSYDGTEWGGSNIM